ncbi:MAG: hypothetical protein U0871_21620 [Gemmataceae bacterium]
MNGTAAPPAPSPVDYVRQLSPEDKQAVFLSLLREAVELNGEKSLLPIEDETGRPFGHYVPPAVADAQLRAVLPPLDPEREAAIRQALATPDRTFDMNEFLDELSREDEG